MKMRKRKGKLQTRLIIYFSCIAIIPALIVLSMSLNFTTSSTEELVGMYTKKLIEQLNCNLGNFISTGRGIVGDLVSSNEIKKMATKNATLTPIEQSDLRVDVAEDIIPAIKMQSAIDGAYIYGQGKLYYQHLKNQDNFNVNVFMESEAYQKMLEMASSEFIWFTLENNGEENIYLARKVNATSDGAVILVMNKAYLEDLLVLSNIENHMSLAILNEKNQVIISSEAIEEIEAWVAENQSEMNTAQENNTTDSTTGNTKIIDGNIVSFITCSNGWKVASFAPISTLMSGFKVATVKAIAILAVCSLIAIGFSIIIGRHLTKPIVKIVKQMDKVTQGDLEHSEDLEKPIKGQTQEIAMLTTGFIGMVKSLREVREASQIVTERVKESTKDLNEETGKTSELEEAVNATIEQVAIGAKSQSEETQSATALMEILSMGVTQVSEVVGGIDQTSKEVMEISHSTERKLNVLSKQSEENIAVTHRIGASVSALGEATKNINNVLNMVKNINNQTEMLALNASIEAVRAGSLGKGFAVIASEVRGLALETNDAIKAIQELLVVIEDKSRSARKELEEATKYFEMQKPVVEDATESFVMIMDRMRYIDKDIHHAHELVGEIIEHNTGALDKIVRINGIAQEFACVTEEASGKTVSQAKCINNIHSLTVELGEVVKELEKCY